MAQFESREEYEMWKAEKLKNKHVPEKETAQQREARERDRIKWEAWEQERIKREAREQARTEREAQEQERAEREAREQEDLDARRTAANKQADKQRTLPYPQKTRLSVFFNVLSALSLLGGCILAAKSWPGSQYGNQFYELQKGASFLWFVSGVVEAALFAFFAQCLEYIRGIYANTYKSE